MTPTGYGGASSHGWRSFSRSRQSPSSSRLCRSGIPPAQRPFRHGRRGALGRYVGPRPSFRAERLWRSSRSPRRRPPVTRQLRRETHRDRAPREDRPAIDLDAAARMGAEHTAGARGRDEVRRRSCSATARRSGVTRDAWFDSSSMSGTRTSTTESCTPTRSERRPAVPPSGRCSRCRPSANLDGSSGSGRRRGLSTVMCPVPAADRGTVPRMPTTLSILMPVFNELTTRGGARSTTRSRPSSRSTRASS